MKNDYYKIADPNPMKWKDFKNSLDSYKGEQWVFRGHANSKDWELQTSIERLESIKRENYLTNSKKQLVFITLRVNSPMIKIL